MIQHHGDFAIQYPANWTAPRFQFGQMVQAEGTTCQIVGLEYITEATASTGCNAKLGWWCMVAYSRFVGEKLIVDVIGHHEDVIQPTTPHTATSYATAHPVSR